MKTLIYIALVIGWRSS